MFKTVKRIIDWCGEFKGKLYLGFVMTFFSHIFAALPLAVQVLVYFAFGGFMLLCLLRMLVNRG